MKKQIESWPGLGVLSRYDRATEAWILIALHDDTLGAPAGGTRLRIYPTPEDGLRDAMRLAEGMTHKWAALDFPFGGGKAVLALSRELSQPERESLLRRYGRTLGWLGRAFSTGEDLGTSPADMLVVAQHTDTVHGVDRERGVARDPGPFTARGVLAAIRATVQRRFGEPDLSKRSFLVQGVGRVGGPLAGLLAEAGARVIVSDVEEASLRDAARRFGCETVSPEAVYDTPCDVYVPCATGGTLSRETVPRLRCAAVAGSANNQLDRPEDGVLLHERGILYAPDYIANAGGALAFGSIHLGVTDETELKRRVDGIGDSLRELFEEAARAGEPPEVAAGRRVRRVLERGPAR